MMLQKLNDQVIIELDSCSNTYIVAIKEDNKWLVKAHLNNQGYARALRDLIGNESAVYEFHNNSAKSALKVFTMEGIPFELNDTWNKFKDNKKVIKF